MEKARKLVEARAYKLGEAAELLKKAHHTKFNETVELAINLGVDPKHSDQVVRGTVGLPNGLGKTVRVLVIAGGEKVREAQEAGADFVGGDDVVDKAGIVHCAIGKIQFDAPKLVANSHAVIEAVVKAKPAAAKGKYVKKITLTSTMGPGISIDLAEAEALATAA